MFSFHSLLSKHSRRVVGSSLLSVNPLLPEKMSEDLARVDEMLEGYRGDDAYEALSKMERSADVEWRMANAIYIQSNYVDDTNERKKKLKEGLALAESALTKDPSNAEAARNAAALCGLLSELSGLMDRMKYGGRFKKFLDKTIELLPEPDMTVLHMRGRFSYQVASLSWIERKAACDVIGAVPEMSFEDALKDLHAAEAIADTLDTLLYIGKSYLGKGDKEKAKEYFEKVVAGPVVDAVDAEYVDEAEKALEKI